MQAVRKQENEISNLTKNDQSSTSTTRTTRTTTTKFKSKPKPKSVELHGITVNFPYEPYSCQEKYMSQVIKALHGSENALLESPTGTGKTLCLLCAALAWQEEFSRRHNITGIPSSSQDEGHAAAEQWKPPTILYASRTHSQLRQVVNELKMTRYRPKHAVLGSREHMCVNERVKKPKASKTGTATSTQINFECGKLTKGRQCHFRNNLDSFRVEELQEASGSVDIQPILDLEDLVQMGQANKICPFYYSRNAVADANIVFLPYNYIFDKEARNGTLSEISWENSIVIFDEAHNLENFASDSASFDLSSSDVAGCIQEIDRCRAYLGSFEEEEGGETGAELTVNNLLNLKGMFFGFEEYLMNQLSPNEASYSGDFILEVLQKGLKLTHDSYVVFLSFLKQISEYMMGVRAATATPNLDFVTSCLKKVFTSESLTTILAHSRSFRVHVSAKLHQLPRTLSYWCFAPSLAMHHLLSLGIRSMIVTSGTLSPLPSYSLELGIPFQITLSNPHVLASPRDQLSVRVLDRGVSNKILKSTYEIRDTKEYIDELGNTIAAVLKVVPGGVLLFFPSYGVMQKSIQGWGGPATASTYANTSNFNQSRNTPKKNFFAKKSPPSAQNKFAFPATNNTTTSTTNTTIWKRLLQLKSIVLEPKSTHLLPDAMEQYRSFIATDPTRGCLLLSVCRGKISEGIDFSDNLCRMVIVTGIPFAPYLDPRVKLKREYLDQAKIRHSSPQTINPVDTGGGFSPPPKTNTANINVGLSGSEWYSQQAHRAVNQAMGRVIRHRFDYGCILLLDARFKEKRNQEGISKWIRDAVQVDQTVGRTVSTCANFFKQAKNRAEEVEKKQQQLLLTSQEEKLKNRQRTSVTLRYEDDTNQKQQEAAQQDILESCNVAMIQTNGNDDQFSNGDGYVRPTQVIKRMVLSNSNDCTKTHNKLKEKHDDNSIIPQSSSSSNASGIAALYNNKEQPKPDTNKLSSEVLHAKKFFQTAKTTLTSTQFSTLRQNVLLLKTVGDVQDERTYLTKLQDIITLLLSHKQLLKLFYPLLPVKYQSFTRAMANRLALQTIRSSAIEKKPQEEVLFQHIPKLPTTKPRNHLLDQPEKQDQQARQIHVEKRNRIQAMRETSRKRIAASMQQSNGVPKAITANTISSNKPASCHNPFKVFHTGTTSNAKSTKIKGTKRSILFQSPIQTQEESPSQVDSLTKYIQQVSKISYIKSPPLLQKVNSNTPKNLQCIICKKHRMDPYLANCNHSACLLCWSTWLSNKTSCPVCRTEVNTRELSKMVFVDEVDQKKVIPKLSQSFGDDFGELEVE